MIIQHTNFGSFTIIRCGHHEGVYDFGAHIHQFCALTGDFNFAVNEGYIVRNGKICEAVRGASLIGNGSQILQDIDMVGQNLATGQGMCGSSSGSVPTDVGQPLIRVSKITVGGR